MNIEYSVYVDKYNNRLIKGYSKCYDNIIAFSGEFNDKELRHSDIIDILNTGHSNALKLAVTRVDNNLIYFGLVRNNQRHEIIVDLENLNKNNQDKKLKNINKMAEAVIAYNIDRCNEIDLLFKYTIHVNIDITDSKNNIMKVENIRFKTKDKYEKYDDFDITLADNIIDAMTEIDKINDEYIRNKCMIFIQDEIDKKSREFVESINENMFKIQQEHRYYENNNLTREQKMKKLKSPDIKMDIKHIADDIFNQTDSEIDKSRQARINADRILIKFLKSGAFDIALIGFDEDKTYNVLEFNKILQKAGKLYNDKAIDDHDLIMITVENLYNEPVECKLEISHDFKTLQEIIKTNKRPFNSDLTFEEAISILNQEEARLIIRDKNEKIKNRMFEEVKKAEAKKSAKK